MDIEGKLNAKGLKFALISSRFNNFITERLIDGAIDCIIRHEGDKKNISIVRVPGSFEIPQIAGIAAKSGKYDAVICLGAVIRGETPHFDYVSAEVSKGIARVASESSIPVTYGIITADTVEQAIDRAGTKMGNRGFDAAMTAIEMANLIKKINS
ncbi:6,7-dimethyl-8-ribityllumazine synthase [candidate division WOR-3 bacterium]|uniref:6,7-dimethyl-8-ribityllumazine synthase n=1 Tax=candidate division TA06 bacterium TaxID=2250710 RepID=A0A660S8T1_UNCT6|nr:6,7-dimethyl-8-ribityllumazine synthase [candidate division WOR-3 bacterium]RKX66558.1 MAG: 6,7-dimethyl-8-ribityllumazine synthase [candidate division TA06 bacterium]